MIVYLYKHRPNEEKKENLDYKLIPPLSPQALLPHGRLSCLEVLTRRYFFFALCLRKENKQEFSIET